MGLTKNQKIILAAFAVVDLLVVAMLGGVIVNQALRAMAGTPPSQPLQTMMVDAEPKTDSTATPVPQTPTPRPAAPTWTPKPSPTPPGWIPPYTYVPGDCTFESPVTVECGYISVPEDRAADTNDTILLAVAVYRSTNANPAADPAIYLSGGPGGAAVEEIVQIYDDYIRPIVAERDFIVFDQRGTGISEPELDCPEYTSAARTDLERAFSAEEQAEAFTTAMERCRKRLVNHGVNLAAYTSAASAADVKDIAAVLGYTQINLYGGSYGTRLALTVMRDFPDLVRSAVLDSAVPVEVDTYNGYAANADRLLRKIFDGCAADRSCRANYPQLETTYYELIERLNTEPAELWVSDPDTNRRYKATLTGVVFTQAIFVAAYASDVIPFIPVMIYNTYHGDYRLVSLFMGLAIGMEDGVSTGMMTSVNCHEEAFATTAEQLAQDYAAYPDLETFANQSVFGLPSTLYAICNAWGVAPFDPREDEPVVSDIPALILSGEYDPVTPPAYGQQLTANLRQSYFFEFPGQGHTPSIGQSECALDIAIAFLRDPWQSPDASCISGMGGPAFE
ncbi:MAG: alpha/beta fold hydrolase [Anaerolineae bacterium]|nr:alpha/beta fold hydrolase [Anaerolineae bacterium]